MEMYKKYCFEFDFLNNFLWYVGVGLFYIRFYLGYQQQNFLIHCK